MFLKISRISFKVIRGFKIHLGHSVKYSGQCFQYHFKILLFLIYFDTSKRHLQFSRNALKVFENMFPYLSIIVVFSLM